MRKFRLKKEAVKFFKDKHATAIYSLDTWEDIQVDIEALEEVEDAYVFPGIKMSENSSSLSGWDEKGSHFHFTIVFPSVKHSEHDKFSKGKISRELLDKIQRDVNDFFEQFLTELNP